MTRWCHDRVLDKTQVYRPKNPYHAENHQADLRRLQTRNRNQQLINSRRDFFISGFQFDGARNLRQHHHGDGMTVK